LSTFLEKLGELAEKGGRTQKSGAIRGLDTEGKVPGACGSTIKAGLGEEVVKVESLGNVRRDDETGRAVVHELRHPMVSVCK